MSGSSSTGSQGPGFTSPVIGNVPSLLNVSPMQTGPSYVVPGNTLKDGNRYILKIADLLFKTFAKYSILAKNT